jgi:F-type H+-transporting ATPase subunit b
MFIAHFNDIVFVTKLIDFIIFVTAIVLVFNKLALPELVIQQHNQNKVVEDAREHREKCEAAIAAAKQAIEQAKVDAVRMVQVGNAQASKFIDDERAEAREHAQRILAHAAGELERERYRVRRELLEETVELAHAQAQDLAKREIGPAQQHTLVERLLLHLERARA